VFKYPALPGPWMLRNPHKNVPAVRHLSITF
jgi:hypothetical protein